MNQARAWSLRVAVLAVAMLAAIGGWETYRGTARGAQASHYYGLALADHFICYKLKDVRELPRVRNTIVEAQNQLGDQRMVLYKPELFCVPTIKLTVESPPPRPDDHHDG
jgi:hypothetical protein